MAAKWFFILIVLVIASTSMIYQFSITTAMIFVLGDGIIIFSLFTGFFLFSMGLGAYLMGNKKSSRNLLLRLQLIMATAGFFVLPFIFLCFGFFAQAKRIAVPSSSNVGIIVLWVIGIGAELIFGTLAGMHLPLLQDLFDHSPEMESKSVAKILSYDYIGSFLGAIFFPIILFPALGLFKTVFLASFINLITVLFCCNFFKKKNYNLTAGIIIMILLVVWAFFKAPYIEFIINGLVYG